MRSSKYPHLLRNGEKNPMRENDSLIIKFDDNIFLLNVEFFPQSL